FYRERPELFQGRAYFFDTGGPPLLAIVAARRHALSQTRGSGPRWIGRPGWSECAWTQLPEPECISHPGFALWRGLDQRGGRRADRSDRRIRPAAAQSRNLLEPVPCSLWVFASFRTSAHLMGTSRMVPDTCAVSSR